MKFPELIEGVLVRRYKRLIADVELVGGEVVVSHCADPGAMRGCAPERARVWLSESARPGRVLRWTWELVEADGSLVRVNTARANLVVAEALAVRKVTELAGWTAPRREVRYGDRSRVDFLLQRGDKLCYSRSRASRSAWAAAWPPFPDSVTDRGTRHLEELMRVVRAGHRAVLLFCVGRTRASVVRPADDIDPVYGAHIAPRRRRRRRDLGLPLPPVPARDQPRDPRACRAVGPQKLSSGASANEASPERMRARVAAT